MSSIYVRMERGPIYGNQMVCQGAESFYFTEASGTDEERQHGEKLSIDGLSVCAEPISNFGFTLEDFAHVPVNRFGLKDIAILEGDYAKTTLTVTANGLFIVYKGGIPSLEGMPSPHAIVSGPIFPPNDYPQFPKLSVYSKSQLASFAVVAMATSFSPVYDDVVNLTHWSSESKKGEDMTVDQLIEEDIHSPYISRYPKLAKSNLEVFKSQKEKGGSFEGFLSMRSEKRKNAVDENIKPKISTDIFSV